MAINQHFHVSSCEVALKTHHFALYCCYLNRCVALTMYSLVLILCMHYSLVIYNGYKHPGGGGGGGRRNRVKPWCVCVSSPPLILVVIEGWGLVYT